ncbi:phospholipase D-like domain-containing protein [Cupriavidus sp. UGS-1]|uniref:phospholipase D-like domain-containing protein n=1 Tax=Cupriavidus sp. UGS-1 TaxID=2899826 RepID=UPI001E5C4FA3|nr:phospholipase D-like domain-containing protein [Cupriavidus sp. UGS-1]MCD9121280.1 hypothetical protein [Cupriavidus sp. UGS-1]
MTRTASPNRVLPQLVGADGSAAEATVTSNVWVGHKGVFSQPTVGNHFQFFTTGKAYFADLIAECDKATQEIYIIGWQVNWDAMLAPNVRLWDVLHRAATRGVQIYVLPWNDTNPVQTYDDQAKAALEAINKLVGEKRVHVELPKSYATRNNAYFSHHQKQVVIDRKIGYVGGIDLAYGRYDDETYDLHADKDGRYALNRYNPCVAWVGKLPEKSDSLIDPDLLSGAADRAKVPFLTKSAAEDVLAKIQKGAFQLPYGEAPTDAVASDAVGLGSSFERNPVSRLTLSAKAQPRMPWQDVHSRIQGPAVSDLTRNFVVRWNACSKLKLRAPQPPEKYEKNGSVQIQVLRSAPAGMRQAEHKGMTAKGAAPSGTEDDIHRAMLQLIAKSDRFIYIESQFFVSAFGREADFGKELSPAAQYINSFGGKDASSGARMAVMADDDSKVRPKVDGFRVKLDVDDKGMFDPPKNGVCQALITRITKAIFTKGKPKYHVYITLPVHPEGALANATIAVQVYWTMQTLVYGSRSLLNGVRRALKARELYEKKDPQYLRVIQDDHNREYESIPIEQCFEYVTLLNLRNWTKLRDRYVTEQIYVHTKLMVVDDLYALLGSANINDRSLLGERDSEIAVLVVDENTKRADINGTGSMRPTRDSAHALRKAVWNKLFGISGKVRPASHLARAIEEPGKPDSWRLIQQQARLNAEAYEKAFHFVPRNRSPFQPDRFASIVPNWNPGKLRPDGVGQGYPDFPQPSEDMFWTAPRHVVDQAGSLEKIKGFITALPIEWTEGEFNRFSYPTMLVADNDEPSSGTNRESMAIAHRSDPARPSERSAV